MMVDLSPYAGRWVALAAGQVAGVGFTPDEAIHLARRNRPKERFAVRFVETAVTDPLQLSPLLDRLRPLLWEQEIPIYLVGGVVRDALLGRTSNDLDFVVPQRAIKLTFKIANALGEPAYILDKERDTGRVVLPDEATTLDFTCFRGADLLTDLRDRDFTINAIAIPATAVSRASLIDPCGGVADLDARLIRQIHEQSVINDPVRGLRGVRLALALGFDLTPETKTAVAAASQLVDTVSIERVRDEFLKLVKTAVPDQALQQLDESNWLTAIVPEVTALRDVAQSAPHHEPVLAHTITVLRWLRLVETAVLENQPAADPISQTIHAALWRFADKLNAHFDQVWDGGVSGHALLRLAAIFHDVGKKETQTVADNGRIRFLGHDNVGAKIAARRLRRLSLSNKAIDHVKHVVAGHMRPLHLAHNLKNTLPRRTVYRYFRATGDAGLDIVLLALADHLATYEGVGDVAQWESLLQVGGDLLHHYFNHHEETIAPPPLVNGRDLIALFNLRPGPEIGRLLRLIQEAQAAGEITTRDEALILAQKSRQ